MREANRPLQSGRPVTAFAGRKTRPYGRFVAAFRARIVAGTYLSGYKRVSFGLQIVQRRGRGMWAAHVRATLTLLPETMRVERRHSVLSDLRPCAFLRPQRHIGPAPWVWFRPGARILVASQAPGARAHAAGRAVRRCLRGAPSRLVWGSARDVF